jgi:nucleoid-associated protein YejK
MAGIRNFLTLFLSIEVSKAMQDVAEARKIGDFARQKYAQTMVDYFTDQMNESNPILTQISEAMTEEGRCLEKLAELATDKHLEEVAVWQARLLAATERKNAGNVRLMECSSRYNNMMRSLRESR